MTEPETTETVEQTETGYRLKIKSKRGTGTRDQDEVQAEVRESTLEEVLDVAGDLRTLVRTSMEEQRKHQPDGPNGDDA